MEFLPGGDMMTLLMKKDTLSEECTQVNDKKGGKIWKVTKFVSKTRKSFYLSMSSKDFFIIEVKVIVHCSLDFSKFCMGIWVN